MSTIASKNYGPRDYWNHNIGSIWEEVFKKTYFPKIGKVVEIAPGSVNKIGYGLNNYGFEGTIYLIEPNNHALDDICSQYSKLFKNVEIIPMQKTLKEAVCILPSCDAIVSNHPLDDMILGNSLNSKEFDGLFDNHYNQPIETTRKYWETLESNISILEKSKSEVLEDWRSAIGKLRPKLTIISQYDSFSFQLNELLQPDVYAQEVLNGLRSEYSQSDKSILLKDIQNISDKSKWLVIKKD